MHNNPPLPICLLTQLHKHPHLTVAQFIQFATLYCIALYCIALHCIALYLQLSSNCNLDSTLLPQLIDFQLTHKSNAVYVVSRRLPVLLHFCLLPVLLATSIAFLRLAQLCTHLLWLIINASQNITLQSPYVQSIVGEG